MHQLRAVVIDDSVVFRSYLIDELSTIAGVRVVGFAADGRAGIDKVRQYKPDLVTLDIEMPVLNGVETLKMLKQEFPNLIVIMVSSLTRSGSEETLKALGNGAFDFVTKPGSSSHFDNKTALHDQLHRIITHLITPGDITPKTRITPPSNTSPSTDTSQKSIVGIGVSTGGPNALSILIPQLPSTLRVPVVIVQHMPPVFTASLAESLAQKSKVKVVEAKNEEELHNGTVYIAPGGCQMSVISSKNGLSKHILLTDDPAENFCKPSVDYLFRSLAKEFKSKAIGIILTGMGKDGTLGLSLMKKFGAKTIAQNEQTSTVFGMPREAIQAGVVDKILPLDSIAEEINQSIN